MPTRTVFIALFAAVLGLASACAGEDPPLPAALELSHAQIRLCGAALGETTVFQDLQLRNTGEEPLVVSNIELRGDASCAFRCFREAADGAAAGKNAPCADESAKSAGFKMTLLPAESRLVRIEYEPSKEGALDRAAVVITSDAANVEANAEGERQTAIPLCGLGRVAADTGDDSASDSAAPEPPAEELELCTACESLAAGAPGCKTR